MINAQKLKSLHSVHSEVTPRPQTAPSSPLCLRQIQWQDHWTAFSSVGCQTERVGFCFLENNWGVLFWYYDGTHLVQLVPKFESDKGTDASFHEIKPTTILRHERVNKVTNSLITDSWVRMQFYSHADVLSYGTKLKDRSKPNLCIVREMFWSRRCTFIVGMFYLTERHMTCNWIPVCEFDGRSFMRSIKRGHRNDVQCATCNDHRQGNVSS